MKSATQQFRIDLSCLTSLFRCDLARFLADELGTANNPVRQTLRADSAS